MMAVVAGRRRAAMLAILVAIPVAACSSGPSTTPTVAAGSAVLGAPYATWVRAHPPVVVDGQAGYGDTVSLNGRSVPQFTRVRQAGGRVVGLHLTLPARTRLGPAEGLVRAQLPPDAGQTASWRGRFPGGTAAYCEFVNYRSATLARWLGTPPPTGATANIGTSLYEVGGSRPGSSSIATVNSADLGTTPNTLDTPC